LPRKLAKLELYTRKNGGHKKLLTMFEQFWDSFEQDFAGPWYLGSSYGLTERFEPFK